MPTPLVTFKNQTEVLVEWGHAMFHRGAPTIASYDLKITHDTLGESTTLSVDGRDSSAFFVNLAALGEDHDWTPDCLNASITNLYNFSIRAVTEDKETGETFLGDWSREEVTPAYCKSKYLH